MRFNTKVQVFLTRLWAVGLSRKSGGLRMRVTETLALDDFFYTMARLCFYVNKELSRVGRS